MCIIVTKDKGVRPLDYKILRTCFAENPDGAGFMVAQGGAVKIHKGYATFDEFKAAFTPYNKKENAVVCHFRIRTHGKKGPEMCHPFPLTRKTKRLRKRETTADVGVAHNGMITWIDGDNDLSDTALFTRDYLTRIITGPDFYRDTKTGDIIEALLSGDRLAVMTGDGHIQRYGSWEMEKGVYYSNESYKGTRKVYTSYTWDKWYEDNGDWFKWYDKADADDTLTVTDYDRGYNDGYYDCLCDMENGDNTFNPYDEGVR